jgi:hypothetical protein
VIFQEAILPYLNSLVYKLNKRVKKLINNIEISEVKLRISPQYEAEGLIAHTELCWHDTHTNYRPVFIIISANTRSKTFVSLLCCGTLNFCPHIDYVDPRHTARYVQLPRHAEQWFRFFLLLRRLVKRVLWLLVVLQSYMIMSRLEIYTAARITGP